jgi:hypothetical protein
MGGLPEPIRVRHPSTDRTSVKVCLFTEDKKKSRAEVKECHVTI